MSANKLFKQKKLQLSTRLMAQIFEDHALSLFPELEAMFTLVNPNSPTHQENALADFVYFSTKFDGSDILKVRVLEIEKAPFVKYEFMDAKSKEIGCRLAVVAAFLFDVLKNDKTSLFPDLDIRNHEILNDISSDPSDFDNEDWVRTAAISFSLMGITLAIDSDIATLQA